MTAYNEDLFDINGRVIRSIVSNTAKDGSGTSLFPVLDSDGHTQVDILSITAGDNRIGIVRPDIKEVRVAKAIDASVGAYAAGDMVNDDDCCTAAVPWEIAGAANAAGGYGAIWGVRLFNETPNLAVQYELLIFNAVPAGTGVEFTDNVANMHPHRLDRAKWVREILMPASVARGATVATYVSASPSSSGKLPLFYKCAAASTTLYFVLVTRTAYTQTATYDIEIAFDIEHF